MVCMTEQYSPENLNLKESPMSNWPETLFPSKIVEILRRLDMEIEYADPRSVIEVLSHLKSTEYTVKSSGQIVTEQQQEQYEVSFERCDGLDAISTSGQPAVLVAYGASFCSLLLAMDDQENIVARHQPMVSGLDDGDLSLAVERFSDYWRKASAVLRGGDQTLLVTGTNPQILNSKSQEVIKRIAEGIATEASTIDLFVRPEFSAYVDRGHSLLSKVKQLFLGIRERFKQKDTLLPNLKSINGLIIVPPSLSKDGKGRVFIMDLEADNEAILTSLLRKEAEV